MDYLKFYDLEREPFQNDPDGRFYYESRVHQRARMRLLRGVQQRKALSVLIGGPGCGKTTLAVHIHEGLRGGEFAARLLPISHADCARGWLLPQVARVFGVEHPAAGGPAQLEQIHEALVVQLSKGRYPVLLIDEAQLLSNAEVMQEFRALLNLVHEGRKTVSVLLFGLPDLSEILRLDAPLSQRVEIRTEVAGLDADEVAAYVRHRLACAGGSAELFAPAALAALHTYTGGVPRLVNTLADNALFEGVLSESRTIDSSLVAAAAEELELQPGGAPIRPSQPAPMVPRAPAPPAPDPIAELDEALIQTGDTPPPEPEGDSYSDFSMGSLVRDMDGDESEDDDPLEIPLAADDSASAMPELGASLELDEADDEDELDLLDAPDPGDSQALGDSGAEQEIELELEEEPVAVGADDSGDSSGFDLGSELRVDGDVDDEADDEEELLGSSASGDTSGAFDPGELLELDDVNEEFEVEETLEPPPDTNSNVASAEPTDEEADENLDDLFENLQAGD
jgi:type II secretory pathway predicted ATPase ExeA